jgi:PAB-dependent poly(A)-specific ribonuclease subunit 2
MIYSYAPSLSLRYHESHRSFRPLVSSGPHMEHMDSSTLVAIDCEFVAVQPELLEVDPETGSSIVVRPARLTLARVSVVRGSGPLSGVPFIDDYISTSEPVVDYLTQYSGISPGDLDRALSPHHLTTLKHAYVRLRALIERGVNFIGHGLKKDFQMLNIILPQKQVFDTVELFSLPNQRKLGLRFLALHVLQVNIQQDTHDSIEDARTALQLYHRYCDLQQRGELKQTIVQLYEIGHRAGFKV